MIDEKIMFRYLIVLTNLWSQLNPTPDIEPSIDLENNQRRDESMELWTDIQTFTRNRINLLLTTFLPNSTSMMAWRLRTDASSHFTRWSTCWWHIHIYVYAIIITSTRTNIIIIMSNCRRKRAIWMYIYIHMSRRTRMRRIVTSVIRLARVVRESVYIYIYVKWRSNFCRFRCYINWRMQVHRTICMYVHRCFCSVTCTVHIRTTIYLHTHRFANAHLLQMT